MSSAVMDELLPVIVAELDEDSFALLEAIAFVGGETSVPLVTAPIDASRHVLEVYSPASSEPLLLFAEPTGAPTDAGFPLRVATYTSQPEARGRSERPITEGRLRARVPTAQRVTAAHALALTASQAPVTADHVGRTLAGGKLHIESLIGSGGMGIVYRAMHRQLHMPVAVKILHERLQRDLEFCRRFHAEALAASRLNHTNLTRVLDFGQEPDGLVYLAMEFLDGIDLRAVLQREGRLPLERIVPIMTQVSAGLSHVHGRGMVHRDMKPDNVVLIAGQDDEDGAIEVVKLCDFGIAVARDAVAREIAGTPEYMSPEQCEGADLDARSDVYACGVMLYEMATGRVPFEGDTAAIIHQQRHVDPPHPLGLHPRLAATIMKALRKDPAERFQSARELRHALRALLASESPASTGSGPVSQPRPHWLDETTGQFVAPQLPLSAGTIKAAADAFLQEPARWLSELVSTTDPRKFATLCEKLETAVPGLAARGEIAVLWRVGSTLALIADEGSPAEGSRAASAQRVRKLLQDPTVLAPAAEDVLFAPRPMREARSLVLGAGVFGAHALYAVRAKSSATSDARIRFTNALREIDVKAWPLLRAALEQLEGKTSPAAIELVEDLLAAVPKAVEEVGGTAVARYMLAAPPRLRRAAASAIVRCWGDRARPALVAHLQDADESVRMGAIAALHEIDAIDAHVVRRFASMLETGAATSPALRTECAVALRHATGTGRPVAIEILRRLVLGAPASTAAEGAVLFAAIRSLLVLTGPSASAVVLERASRTLEPLKTRLLELIDAQ